MSTGAEQREADAARQERQRRKWADWQADDRRPLTVAEWAERAEWLEAAARERVESGRGTDGDTWHAFLTDLAAVYRHNARCCANGEPLEDVRAAVSVPVCLRSILMGGGRARVG